MIVVQLLGGMGNQMFQYAIGKSLATKNNANLKLDISFIQNRVPVKNFVYRNFDLDIFNLNGSIENDFNLPLYPQNKSIKSVVYRIKHFIQLKIKGFNYIKEFTFSFKPSLLSKKGNFYLDGYWQSFRYFDEIEDVIRQDFTVKESIDKYSLGLLNKISQSNSVCINIRRTDYLTDSSFNVFGMEYVQNAVDMMNSKLKDPFYFVFSDDIEWCIENIKINNNIEYVSHKHAGKKFKDYFILMQNCKNFIIPNSTFAWWAAWLCENKQKYVIVPAKWFVDPKIDISNLIPDKWIKL